METILSIVLLFFVLILIVLVSILIGVVTAVLNFGKRIVNGIMRFFDVL